MGAGRSACGKADNPCALGCLEGLVWAAVDRAPTGTPLPRQPHRVLRRDEVCRGGRIFIVGDVHGCIDELHQLLDREAFDACSGDTLVLVGDLVNKGPGSGAVIRLARDLGAFVVRGNHDEDLLQAWYRVGRYTHGLQRYRHNALEQVSAADIRWLQEQPLSLCFPWLHLLVVHAGLVPGVPLEQQKFKTLLWMRDLKRSEADESGWIALETPEVTSHPWASIWSGPQHVVFGHDAIRKLQLHPFATGLDTGCCYGYELTALLVDPDDFSKRHTVQVPAVKMHSKPTAV
eukprot:gnl/TRDRNA2_/TRDRNA2_133620_c0_seq1.p1 gnl/TRDRNA2_/TRDRNA2_133620_c0~~gnl/TRDRNA2_/TRDRNA2_133620_c0_seq1.p1  ORF type:complete len:289 (+),score=44.35 gnl/TRDRNA2_/TRDRNA2_133620_c0_seq1:8-874(+)